jgi:hypothetical protein
MFHSTATGTATIVELLDGLVKMGLRQVRVARRHRKRLVAHQLAEAVQVHPFIASREANVCQRSCYRKFLIPASRTAGLKMR